MTDQRIPMDADPLALARDWFEAAKDTGVVQPRAMALATVDDDGRPTNRVVQLATIDSGFVFATDARSPKARHLEAAGAGAIVLHLREAVRQIRAVGGVETVEGDAAAESFTRRRPLARATSIVGVQSTSMPADADALVAEAARTIADDEVPPTWTALRLVPDEIEFWTSTDDDHQRRVRYSRTPDGWTAEALWP